MARMLGRYRSSGCHPCTIPGPDCSGHERDTRWRRRVEQREFRLSLLPEATLPPVPGERDCRHGCDGECLLYGGPHECGLTCHSGDPAR